MSINVHAYKYLEITIRYAWRSHDHSLVNPGNSTYVRCSIHFIGVFISQGMSALTTLAYIYRKNDCTFSPSSTSMPYITRILSTWLDVVKEANDLTTFRKNVSFVFQKLLSINALNIIIFKIPSIDACAMATTE